MSDARLASIGALVGILLVLFTTKAADHIDPIKSLMLSALIFACLAVALFSKSERTGA